MDHVGAIEAFAEVHKQFGGDQLLGRQYASGHAEHFGGRAAINPRLVDGDDGVAHAGNEIDEVAVAMRLGQPDWVAYLGFETLFIQVLKCPRHCIGGQKEIEVLGVPPDAGMLLQRERARHHVRHVGAIHVPKHVAK